MHVIRDASELNRCIVNLHAADVLFVDLETTGLDPYSSKIILMSIRGAGETYVIDFTKVPIWYLRAFQPLLESKHIVKVLHNAVFDWKHIYHNSGIFMEPVYCTLIAEQVLKAGYFNTGFGLDDVAARRLSRVMNKAIRDGFINRDVNSEFTDEELNYSAADVDALEPIYTQQRGEIAGEKLERVIALESSIIPYTSLMEYHGVSVNKKKLEEALPVIDVIIQRSERALQDEIIKGGAAESIMFSRDGYVAVNTGSPKQMLAAINALGIDVKSLSSKELSDWDHRWLMDNKDKIVATESSDDADDELNIGFAHPFLRKHAIRTAAAKIKGTYIEGLLQRINPVTGKIHPGFRQCGAVATGRMSSQSPKLGR